MTLGTEGRTGLGSRPGTRLGTRLGARPGGGAVTSVVLALVVLVSVVASDGLDSALPLVAVTVGVSIAAHAPRVGWHLSTAVVLLALTVLQVVVSWFAPHVGWSLATDSAIAWCVWALVHVALLARLPAGTWYGPRVRDLVSIGLVPIALAGYFGWTAATAANSWIGWSMQGDSANNMILNREFVEQGGLLRSQGNGAPLATVLHGSWAAPGLDLDSRSEAVRQMVTGAGVMMLALVALLSVLGSMMALRRLPAGSPQRLAAGVAAGLIPWLWCIGGYVFSYGYQNATPGMLMLALTWLCWTEQRHHAVTAVTGLVLATWAAAIAWGPTLLIPAFLLVAAVVRQRRTLRHAGRTLLLPLAALLGALAYGVLVTLRDLTAQGGVPGADGAHPPLDQHWLIGVVVVAAVGLVVLHRRVDADLQWGFWVALVAAGLVLFQLGRARQASDLPFWGYYPIKFAWIALTVAALVAFAETYPFFARISRRLWAGSGAVLALGIAYALFFQLSAPVRPVSVSGVLTPVRLHDSNLDAVYDEMFDIMAVDPKTVVSSYWGPPGGEGEDSQTNFWLLEAGAYGIADPIRFPAYTMNSRDPAGLCWAITSWNGGVTVLTRHDPERLEKKLARDCVADPATYDVVGRREFFDR